MAIEAVFYALVAFFGALFGAGACGFVLWRLLSRRIVEPQVVYEKPERKQLIMVPGEGVIAVHSKRKCKHMDEEHLADEERKKLNS